MTNDNMQHICVVGYNWSGSSAVVDLLKEFKENWDPEAEFFMLTQPHGVMDLENVLFERWDPHNVDIAIHDFMDFAENINRNQGKFQRGINYENHFKGKFLEATRSFINDITDYTFEGYWWIYDFRKPYIKWLVEKISNKFVPKEKLETMYYSRPSREEFYEAVKKYMNRLVKTISEDKNCHNIILDQAVQPQHPGKAFDYFDNAKVIVVDRDPRDIYCDLVELKKLIGKDISVTHDTSKFVKWHKDYRSFGKIKNDRIMYLQFEDLIKDYDKTVKKIIDFVSDGKGLTWEKPGMYFKPQISARNVGKFKDFPYLEEIKNLERELGEFLYNKES